MTWEELSLLREFMGWLVASGTRSFVCGDNGKFGQVRAVNADDNLVLVGWSDGSWGWLPPSEFVIVRRDHYDNSLFARSRGRVIPVQRK